MLVLDHLPGIQDYQLQQSRAQRPDIHVSGAGLLSLDLEIPGDLGVKIKG